MSKCFEIKISRKQFYNKLMLKLNFSRGINKLTPQDGENWISRFETYKEFCEARKELQESFIPFETNL